MDDKMMKKAAAKMLKKLGSLSDKDVEAISITFMMKGGDMPYPKMKKMEKEEVEEKEEEEVEDKEETEY